MPFGAMRHGYTFQAAGGGAAVARDEIIVNAIGDAQLSRDQSKFGNSSLLLDANGDYLKINSSYNSYFTLDDFTIEAWGYQTTNTGFQCILSNWEHGFIFAAVSGNTLRMYINSSLVVDATGLTFAEDTWHHLAATRSGSDVKVFLNGTQVGSTGTNNTTFNLNDFTGVGINVNNSPVNNPNGYWDGHLDELRVSSVARYTSNFTVPSTAFVNDSDTVLLMHMDGFAGDDTFLDDTGVRTYVSPDFLYVANSIEGEYDTSQKKFGTSSWYNKDEYTALQLHQTDWSDGVGTGEFTIEMWVRRETKSDNTDYWLVNANNNETGLYYDVSANSLKFSTEGIDRITGGSLNTNTWYHVAVTRDSSNNTKLFINGTQSGSTTTANDRNWANVNYWAFFGDTAGDSGFKGHIDEMRISTVARYTSNFTAPSAAFTNDADTILLYHFEGTNGTSTSIIDDNA